MSNNYFIINQSGIVINTIVWDGISPYTPDNGTLVSANTVPYGVGFGCKRENNKWFKSEYNFETGEETWTEIK